MLLYITFVAPLLRSKSKLGVRKEKLSLFVFAICFPDLISRKHRIFPSENSWILFLTLSAFQCRRAWQARSGKLLKTGITKDLIIKMETMVKLYISRCPFQIFLLRFKLKVFCLGFWIETPNGLSLPAG